MTMPREGLYRSAPTLEVRAAGDEMEGVTLFGHFSRFNEWTRIDSMWEGTFMERIAPGAFKKTFAERTPKILFQHGRDPEVGDKPIAEVTELKEDKTGAYYEARLFEGLPALVAEGLRAGQYGASFGFQVVREDIDSEPDPSESNPQGLPERTITEIKLREFGPVTFPAYDGATAGVRSLTDDVLLAQMLQHPDRLREILAQRPGTRTLEIEITGDTDALERAVETSDDEPVPPQGTPASVLKAIAEAKARDARFAALRASRFVK
jgi:HK97 family phage prohead protease